MSSDSKNVKLGACRVKFGGVDLGLTKGGVEVQVATETKKVNVDQFGTTEVNEYIQGRTVKVTAPLAETTLENLKKITPGASLTTQAVSIKAAGSIEFAGQPVDNDTITVNGIVFTFTAAGSGANEIAIGADLATTLANAATELNGAADAELTVATYSSTATAITITYGTAGDAGNAFTLGASAAIPSGATLEGGYVGEHSLVTVVTGNGKSLLDFAQELVLHPVANADNDKSEDVTIPKASTAGSYTFAFKFDEERVFNVEFSGYADVNTGVLFKVGDTAIS